MTWTIINMNHTLVHRDTYCKWPRCVKPIFYRHINQQCHNLQSYRPEEYSLLHKRLRAIVRSVSSWQNGSLHVVNRHHHHYVPYVVNRSAVMDLHRSRSCATLIQSLYDIFVHSLMLSVHIVLGLPRPLLPFILPSISNRCTPSPLINRQFCRIDSYILASASNETYLHFNLFLVKAVYERDLEMLSGF